MKASLRVYALAALLLATGCAAIELVHAAATESATDALQGDNQGAADSGATDWLAWPRRLAAQVGSSAMAFVPQYIPSRNQNQRLSAIPKLPEPMLVSPLKAPASADITSNQRTAAYTPKPSSGRYSATKPSFVSAAKAPSNTTSVLLPWLHNQYRSRHQNTPKLVWNAKLAKASTAWSKKCIFAHSGAKGVGENLYGGFYFKSVPHKLSDDWAHAIFGFYSEISAYKWDKPAFAKNTGHFTQVVWSGTASVGCGQWTCPSGMGPDVEMVIYTCQYTNQGNIATTKSFTSNIYPLV